MSSTTKNNTVTDGPPFDGPLDGAQMAQPIGSRATSLHEIAVQYWRIQRLRDELRGLPEKPLVHIWSYSTKELQQQRSGWEAVIAEAEQHKAETQIRLLYLELRERLDQAKIDLEALLAAAVDDSVVLP